MRLEIAKPQTASLNLLAAEDSIAHEDNRDPSVVRCIDLSTEDVVRDYQPIRCLMWHLEELGGGTSAPTVRPQACIDAYAALIAGVDADVVVLLDVRWGRKRQIARGKTRDGSFFLRFEAAVEDSGSQEVARILTALKRADRSGGWRVTYPEDRTGAHVYHRGATVAVLYRAGKGIALAKHELARGWDQEILGVGGVLAAVSFEITGEGFAPWPWPLGVVAPLNVLATQNIPFEDRGDEPEPPSGALPDCFLFAFSARADLVRQGARLSALRAQLGLDARSLPSDGTVLKRPYWEKIVEDHEFLIDNAIGLNVADFLVHDARMHWQALELPEHPDELDDVIGSLSDHFFVRSGSAEPPPRLEDLRVVDLVRATLPSHSAVYRRGRPATAGGEPGARDEDGTLTGTLKRYVREAQRTPPMLSSEALAEAEDEDPVQQDAIRTLATSIDFVRRLSDHWPLIVTVRPEA